MTCVCWFVLWITQRWLDLRKNNMTDAKLRLINSSASIPLSHAVVAAGLVHVSGQVGFKPGTTELVSDDLAEQCRQTLANVDAQLQAAGTQRDRIIKCNIYLKDVKAGFAVMNECYAAWLGDHRPARTTVGAQMALDTILVEVDCVALASNA